MKKLLLIFLMLGIIPSKAFCQEYSLRICIQDCQVNDKNIFRANDDTVFVSEAKNKLFWIKGNVADSIGVNIFARKGYPDLFFSNDKEPTEHKLIWIEFHAMEGDEMIKINTTSSFIIDDLSDYEKCSTNYNSNSVTNKTSMSMNYVVCLKQK